MRTRTRRGEVDGFMVIIVAFFCLLAILVIFDPFKGTREKAVEVELIRAKTKLLEAQAATQPVLTEKEDAN